MNKVQKPNDTWLESLKSRIHIFAYVSVSIFLITQGNKLSNSLIEIIGVLFLIPALILLLSLLPSRILKKFAEYAENFSLLSLYLVVIVIFIKESLDWVALTQNTAILWVIPGILIVFLLYDVISIIKDFCSRAKEKGTRETVIRQLKILSFVLTYFVLLLLAFGVQNLGNLVFWLIPAVACQLVVLFLDKTIVWKSFLK